MSTSSKTRTRLLNKLLLKGHEKITKSLDLLPGAFYLYAQIVIKSPEFVVKNSIVLRLPSQWLTERKKLCNNWKHIKKNILTISIVFHYITVAFLRCFPLSLKNIFKVIKPRHVCIFFRNKRNVDIHLGVF